ncbi:hypothetical protein Tco_0390844 [Tanacetum coccineum]
MASGWPDGTGTRKYAFSKALANGSSPITLGEAFSLARIAKASCLVSRPTTLGDAFSLARITEACFEAIVEKEHNIKEKADTTLTLPSEEVSPVVKGPLDASEYTLISLRRPVDEVISVIEDVFDIDESNMEGMQVPDKFAEFFEDKGSVEKGFMGASTNLQGLEVSPDGYK